MRIEKSLPRNTWLAVAFVFVSAMMVSPILLGADPVPAGQQPATEELVQLNFPNEVELEGLVEYISQRMGVKILYDESIRGKKIRIRAPGKIPADSLMMVLQNALRMKGFTLVDGDVQGWKQIRPAENLLNVAPHGKAEDIARTQGLGAPVMQVFMPQHADLAQIEQLAKPFLSKPGGDLTMVKSSGVIIVTDYAVNVLRIAELISMIDRPKLDVVTKFIPVQHVDADELAKQLTAILEAQAQSQGRSRETGSLVSADPRTNQLILVGRREDVEASLALLRSLDVPSSLITEVYTFQYVGAGRIDELIAKSLDPEEAKRVYRSAVDTGNNSLIATTTERIHQQIANLKKTMDLPVPHQQSLMRFYKLKNTAVTEVLKTIQSLQQNGYGMETNSGSFGAFGGHGFGNDSLSSPNNQVAGGISLPLRPGEPNPPLRIVDGAGNGQPAASGEQGMLPDVARIATDATAASGMSQFSQNVRMTADVNTNTLIVIAEPQLQKYYERLIELLDHRSPQVLIEAKVVTLDTTGDFSLGVEISGGDRQGDKRLFAFSSFGLSTPDPVTGALALIPGVGFNGTLVDPSTADVIVRAMSNHTRAKIVASPRILVNDNVEGRLQSVVSIPYQSVNASQTVATSSLGGNQDAGTMISVTPHIGEDDQLQLEFSIQFSSFGEGGSAALPPPRHIDQLDSTVTIPDGYTVIVGGLNRCDNTQSVSGLPFLENIPVVRYLVSLQTSSAKNTALFVFIRPVILRKDKFEDLKFLSDRDVHSSQIPPEFPASGPLLVR